MLVTCPKGKVANKETFNAPVVQSGAAPGDGASKANANSTLSVSDSMGLSCTFIVNGWHMLHPNIPT